MASLLDVNVLIARVDSRHEGHARMLRWERDRPGELIVTCPLTENGFLRIYGHPKYPGGPGSPAEAMVELRHLRSLGIHRFISDSISLDGPSLLRTLEGVTPRQLTDVYLLALAVRHGLDFLTFDEGIAAGCVTGGAEALHIVG